MFKLQLFYKITALFSKISTFSLYKGRILCRSHQDCVSETQTQQAFLNDLDEKLWSAADRLRQQLDAANYKHIVLGLIFLKYISDSFTAQQEKIRAELTDSKNPLYLDRTFYDSDEDYQKALTAELENRDYYIADNVFWVPPSARWQALQSVAFFNTGTELPWGGKFAGVARLIDDALMLLKKTTLNSKAYCNALVAMG